MMMHIIWCSACMIYFFLSNMLNWFQMNGVYVERIGIVMKIMKIHSSDTFFMYLLCVPKYLLWKFSANKTILGSFVCVWNKFLGCCIFSVAFALKFPKINKDCGIAVWYGMENTFFIKSKSKFISEEFYSK